MLNIPANCVPDQLVHKQPHHDPKPGKQSLRYLDEISGHPGQPRPPMTLAPFSTHDKISK